MPQEKYPNIINAICCMDKWALEEELLAFDHMHHFTIKVFVKRMSEMFERFREYGDTMLLANEGSCSNKTCNYKCPGIMLIGNNSRNFVSVVFEESNFLLREITHCHDFRTKDLTCVSKKAPLRIGLTEGLDFNPTPQYIKNYKAIESAYQTLTQIDSQIENPFPLLEAWKENFSYLDNTKKKGFFLTPTHIREFSNTVDRVSELLEVYNPIREQQLSSIIDSHPENFDIKPTLKFYLKHVEFIETLFSRLIPLDDFFFNFKQDSPIAKFRDENKLEINISLAINHFILHDLVKGSRYSLVKWGLGVSEDADVPNLRHFYLEGFLEREHPELLDEVRQEILIESLK